MSRIKDDLLRQEEIRGEYHAQFMDFLYDAFSPMMLSDDDINKMEEDSNEPSTAESLIVSQNALNNIYYDNSPMGA